MLHFFKKNNNKISFIFGVPRSGTTWLWSLLESHQNVVPFLNDVVKDKEGFYEISETAIFKKSTKAKSIVQKFANQNFDSVIIEKTPYHTLLFEKIFKAFPISKNLLIMRHPCSIANSMINSDMNAFMGYDIEKSTYEIKIFYAKIKDLIKKDNLHVVTYESLIDNTEEELTKIFNYLDLDSINVDKIVSDNSKSTKVKVKGAFRKGEKKSYLKDLAHSQIKEVESILVEEIELYNEISRIK